MKIFHKKYSSLIIINILLFIFLFWFAYPILSNLFIFDIDDMNSTLAPYPFLLEENGRYVCHIISRIICVYIPNIFGIHLQNAINTIGMFAYILILTLLFTIIAKFYYLRDKNTIVYALIWVFTALMFFSYTSPNGYFYSLIISFQYGYVLAAAFSIIFLYIVYRYLLIIQTGRYPFKYSQKKIILYGILAFCAGNSTQIATYSLFVILMLFGLLVFIKNKFNFKKTTKFLFNKNTLPVLTGYLLGFLSMVCCPGFWNEVAWRHSSSVHQVFVDFIPFVKDWYDVVIIHNIHFYAIIGIILIANIMKEYSSGKKITYILFNCFLKIIPIFGVWAYYCTLILGGRTFGGSNISFWLIEPFYYFYTLMIFSVVISMLVGEYSRKNDLCNKLIISFCIYLFLSPIITNNLVFEKRNEFTRILSEERKIHYDVEKALLLSVYKKELVFLPAEKRQNINILFNIKEYLNAVYNIKNNDSIIIESDYATTMEHFYSMGGIITKEEREKADFQKLFDKNFVLNNTEDKE